MPNNIAVKITADTADLTAKMAVAQVQMKDFGKVMREVAREVAAGDTSEETRKKLLANADGYSRAGSEAQLYARQVKSLTAVQQAANGISGQQRQSLIVVGEQFRQMSTEAALGISAQQIFAQQAGQTVQAMSMMFGEGSKLGAFLTSTWGIALTTGAAVVLPLIANLLKSSDATSDLIQKMAEDARKTEETRQAKIAFANTIEGVIQAVNDEKEALDKNADALKTEAQRAYEAADAQHAKAVTTREATLATLEARKASLQAAADPALAIVPGMASTQNFYQNQVIEATADIVKAQTALQQAQDNLTQRRANLDVETGRRMADPVEQVRAKYEGSNGLIEAARRRAVAEGKTGDELQRQVTMLAKQEAAEVTAAQKSKSGGAAAARHAAAEARSAAREAYQDHIAALNLTIEADRDNWKQQQADWKVKLAFIKSVHGAESKEYKDASAQFLRLQAERNDAEMHAAEQHAQKSLAFLRNTLTEEEQLRAGEAAMEEQRLRASGDGGFGGEVKAMQRIAAMHRQDAEEKIANLELYRAAESATYTELITEARARYGDDLTKYQSLLDAKAAADQRYAAGKKKLDQDMRAESLRDILSVRQAYHGYIDGLVHESVTGFTGLITRQRSWADVSRGLYTSVLRSVEVGLERMVSKWIVEHLLMSAAQRAQLALQTGQQVTAEVAKTGAVAAGTAARVATTEVGAATSAKITSLHNLKEITSHAAVAAAAAYHAMAGIPIIGPVLGAAAAAVTFTAVEAFGALASFDKGTNMLPTDMIAQVHAGERIIPAADNRALMDAVNDNSGRGGRGGDIHHHTWNITAMDGRSVKRLLMDEKGAVAHALRSYARNGGR